MELNQGKSGRKENQATALKQKRSKGHGSEKRPHDGKAERNQSSCLNRGEDDDTRKRRGLGAVSPNAPLEKVPGGGKFPRGMDNQKRGGRKKNRGSGKPKTPVLEKAARRIPLQYPEPSNRGAKPVGGERGGKPERRPNYPSGEKRRDILEKHF